MQAPAAPDDASSPILHVDMDAFFAAVHVRERPDLRGRPVVVGGGARGVVLSATYEARRFGVRSAMPIGQARRLCPTAVFLPADHDRYRAASGAIMTIFRDVTPRVAPLSLDEAFLDVSGARRLLGSPVRIAAAIRARVRAEQGLTCSVGAAPSLFVAKIASGRCKPDGLLVVPAEGVRSFLNPLPVSAMWGVGPATEQALSRLGLRTMAEVADTPVDVLCRAVGVAAGTRLHELAAGRDDRTVEPDVRERSVGAEETFPADTGEHRVILRQLLRLSDRVGHRLRRGGRASATISIKIRYGDFTTVTRARTLPEPTDVTQTIYHTARDLYEALPERGRAVRLLGVRAERLVDAAGAARQLTIDEPPPGWAELDRAADAAGRRFGRGALRPATLLASGSDAVPHDGAG
jgi:DNA polymerase-4